MAYVTRCPYCGAVWRLPNKETAEGAPVKCSKCRNFFDATRDLLCVPDDLFPEIAKENEEKAAIDAAQKPAEPASPSPVFKPATPQAPFVAPKFDAPAAPVAPFKVEVTKESDKASSDSAVVSPAPEAPVVEKEPEQAKEPVAGEDPLFAAPKAPVAPTRQSIALKQADEAKEKLEKLSTLMSDFSGRTEPTVGTPKKLEPEKAPLTEPKNSTEAGVAVTQAVARKRQKRSYSGPLLVLALFLVILCVAALIFNQSVLAKFPKTKPVFEAVCTKITCPGFYLNNIEAFAVTKAQLTNSGTPGSYTLEVTIMNGSNIAQAMPYLSLQLVDENDAEITRQVLAPADFLADPGVKSLGAGRSLSIHVNMRTNATPSRCIATPIYP